MIVQEIFIFLTEMKFFEDKRFSDKIVIRERKEDKTCEEEQWSFKDKGKKRIPEKAISNKTTKCQYQYYLQLGAVIAIIMITCHV